MKTIQKNIYIILCSAVLILMACFAAEGETAPYLGFSVTGSDPAAACEIAVYDAGDGNCWVFMPSYAEMEQVSVVLEGRLRVSLDGTRLYNGMSCGGFRLEKPYVLTSDSGETSTLRFCRSSNVAAMYINTASGSMEDIHADREYEEYASVALFTPEGELDYFDKAVTLEGRGNTSWSRPKKSYTVTLRRSSPLLDMGASGKWVLNSNGFDMTGLHNSMVYRFADGVGTLPAWSPDCAYVDVYLNGTYNGLYLLCQKIDAGADHLDLSREDYLAELTLSGRVWDSPSAFYVSSRRSLEILWPSNCTGDQMNPLLYFVADFQTALYSDTGVHPETGLAWWEYIDLDSWARKYLIEEVFSNFDGGKASQYFWLDTSRQKLYAGPCWDYDLTFGQFWETNWTSPVCLLARRNWEGDQSWYNALWGKEVFQKAVTELYAGEFRPLLQQYADRVIPETAAQIRQAVSLDQRRWPSLYRKTDWDASADSMQEYLRKRMDFLDSLWIHKADFAMVTLEVAEVYNICLPAGSVCTGIPDPKTLGTEGVWYLAGTEEPFDLTQPVTGDITLTARLPD